MMEPAEPGSTRDWIAATLVVAGFVAALWALDQYMRRQEINLDDPANEEIGRAYIAGVIAGMRAEHDRANYNLPPGPHGAVDTKGTTATFQPAPDPWEQWASDAGETPEGTEAGETADDEQKGSVD